MKRISVVLALTIGSIGLFFLTPTPSGSAATNGSLIIVSGPTHREMSGKFIDDSLIEDLTLGGKLADVLKPSIKSRTWLIDPSLIEEIIDMSDGYTVLPKVKGAGEEIATRFLVDLKYAIGDDPVYALPYGSPKISTRNQGASGHNCRRSDEIRFITHFSPEPFLALRSLRNIRVPAAPSNNNPAIAITQPTIGPITAMVTASVEISWYLRPRNVSSWACSSTLPLAIAVTGTKT